jgi:hypothetical protein
MIAKAGENIPQQASQKLLRMRGWNVFAYFPTLNHKLVLRMLKVHTSCPPILPALLKPAKKLIIQVV